METFPDDMPDLREATNHLAPLTLPAQLAMYIPGREHRFGFQVRIKDMFYSLSEPCII